MKFRRTRKQRVQKGGAPPPNAPPPNAQPPNAPPPNAPPPNPPIQVSKNKYKRVDKQGLCEAALYNYSSGDISRFFKYLMFDPYIQNSIGSGSYDMALKFWNHIKNYNITNEFLIKETDCLNAFFEKDTSNIYTYDAAKEKQIFHSDILTRYSMCPLLSGYRHGGGHAVCLFIDYRTSSADKMDVYIINSGEGIEYHKPISLDKSIIPVVLKFTVNRNIIETIFDIHYICCADITASLTYSNALRNFIFKDLFNLGDSDITSASILDEIKSILPEDVRDKVINNNFNAIKSIFLEETDHLNTIIEFIRTDREKDPSRYNAEFSNLNIINSWYKNNFYQFNRGIIETWKDSQSEPIINIDFFYKELFKALNIDIVDPTIDHFKSDRQQYSGSCSFFSIKYFFKHIIFQNDDEFEEYMRFVEKEELNIFITDFDQTLDWNDGMTLINPYAKNFATMAQIILKDHLNSLTKHTKNKLITNIYRLYSKFENSFNIERNKIPQRFNINVKIYIDAFDTYMKGEKTVLTLETCLNILDPLHNYFSDNIMNMLYLLQIRCIKELYKILKTEPKINIPLDYNITNNPFYKLLSDNDCGIVFPDQKLKSIKSFLLLGCIFVQFNNPFKYSDRFKEGIYTEQQIKLIIAGWYATININLHYIGLIPIKEIFSMIYKFIPIIFKENGIESVDKFNKAKLDTFVISIYTSPGGVLPDQSDVIISNTKELGERHKDKHNNFKSIILNKFNLLINQINQGISVVSIDIKNLEEVLYNNSLNTNFTDEVIRIDAPDNFIMIKSNSYGSFTDDFLQMTFEQLDLTKFSEIAHALDKDVFDFILSMLHIYRKEDIIKVPSIRINDSEWYDSINKQDSKMKLFFINKTIHQFIDDDIIIPYELITSYDYEADTFIEYITNTFQQINDKEYLRIPTKTGYTILYNTPLNNIFPASYLYKQNDAPDTYLLSNATESLFTYTPPAIQKTINEILYTYKQSSPNFLIRKITRYMPAFIWEGTNNITRIDLKDSASYFEIDMSKNTQYFISNNITYNVITNYGSLLGLWVYNMTNGFILERNNMYYLLLCMDRTYIYDIIKSYNTISSYWNENIDLKQFGLEMNCMNIPYKEHIIPFHHTLLSLKTNAIEELSAIFISLWIAQNNMGLYLIRQQFLNVYANAYTMNNANVSNVYPIKNYIDTLTIPYWVLFYTDRSKIPYDLSIRSHLYSFQPMEPYVTREDYDFSEILDMPEYKNIKDFSDDFDAIRKIYIAGDPTNMLETFLKEFRYKCRDITAENNARFKTIADRIVANYPRVNDIQTSGDKIIKALVLTNKQLPHLIGLYSTFYKEFYKNLIDLRFLEIIDRLQHLEAPDKIKDTVKKCGRVLKEIELLDKRLIYDFVNPRTTVDIAFELQTGYILRDEQKKALTDIYGNIDTSTTAYEILMGRGKTSTFTPMLILQRYLTSPTKDFSVVLPSHLVESSYSILAESLLMIPDVIVQKFPETLDSSTDKYSLYTLYPNSVKILSDTLIKYIVLDKYTNDNTATVNKEKFNHKPNLFLFDEVDTLINPLKSYLNIPYGKEESHPYLNDILQICFNTLKNYHSNTDVATNASNTINILHPNNKDVYLYSGSIDSSPEISAILNTKINRLLSSIDSSMKYNQSYGFGNYDSAKPIIEQKNFFVAIPYGANKKPINGSEFTDFELSTMLTILSYINSSIRTEDVLLYLSIIQQQLKSFNAIKENISLYDTILNVYCEELLTFTDMATIKKCIYEIEENRLPNKLCAIIAEAINKGDIYLFLQAYLTNIIFKYYFNIRLEQNNISMIDVYSPYISNKKVSFSGTVNFNPPGKVIQTDLLEEDVKPEYYNGQITDIKNDVSVGGSIEAAVKGTTTYKSDMIEYTVKDQDTIENELLDKIKESKGAYSALIDAGGLILNKTPLDVIEYVKDSLSEDTVILYIDNTGTRQIYNTGHPYKNDPFPKLFIYYDQKHSVGIDFKQPFEMKGLVTISKKNTLTEVSQGIFRLRGINIGHSVNFYYDKNIPSVTTSEELFTFLQKNDKSMIESTVEEAKLQCIKYVDRTKQDYNKVSYQEHVFYDSIKIESKYYTEQDFITELVNKLSVKSKPIVIKESAPKQNVNVNVNIEIQQITKVAITLYSHNIRTASTETTPITQYIANEPGWMISGDNIYDNDKKIMPAIFSIETKTNITWILRTSSPALIYRNYLSDSVVDSDNFYNNCYFIYLFDETKEDSTFCRVHMITLFEYILLRNYISSLDKIPDMVIYNIYMKPVFYTPTIDPSTFPTIPLLFQILFFKNPIKLTDIFHELKTNPEIIPKIPFFQNFFRREYPFIVTDKSTLDPTKYEDWATLLNIPRITNDIGGIENKLFKFFCTNYVYPDEPAIDCDASLHNANNNGNNSLSGITNAINRSKAAAAAEAAADAEALAAASNAKKNSHVVGGQNNAAVVGSSAEATSVGGGRKRYHRSRRIIYSKLRNKSRRSKHLK